MSFQSVFFAELDPSSDLVDKLNLALGTIGEVGHQVAEALVREYPTFLTAATTGQSEKLIQDQVERLGVTRRQAGAIVDGLYSPLLSWFLDDRFSSDTPEAITDDLVTEGYASADQREELLALISVLSQSVVPIVRKHRSMQRVAAGVMPSLKGVASTIELRGVLRESFALGDDPQGYRPSLEGSVGIASLAITVDRGMPETFAFQCNRQELAIFVGRLQATLKELDMLVERYDSEQARAGDLEHPGSSETPEGGD